MQRLRIKFSRGETLKYISHLDIIRLWQRAMRRADIPVAYTEGFNPRPRIALGAPLALGVTSQAELLDVYCTRLPSAHWFQQALARQLPDGIAISQVQIVPEVFPSLQSQLRAAEYIVTLAAGTDQSAIEAALTEFLVLETLPWEHHRDTGPHRYDLRALVEDLWVSEWQAGNLSLGMRLRHDNAGAGRPEQVVRALGFGAPDSIHRTRLFLAAG
jgi:radical SAM-linked protein